MAQVGQWRVPLQEVKCEPGVDPVVVSHFFEGDHALCGLFAVSESTFSEPTATQAYGVAPVRHDVCEQVLGTKETRRVDTRLKNQGGERHG